MYFPPGMTLAEIERRLILATLDRCDGDKRFAAAILGISHKTVYNKLNHYRANNMLKRDEIEQPTSCLNKSDADEPLFVLCARDPHAAGAVENWAQQAEQTGLHSPAKILEARGCAAKMREWRSNHFSGEHAERAAQADAANKFEG